MASTKPFYTRAGGGGTSLYGGRLGNYKNQIRPFTPESIQSDGSEDKFTRHQATCINTLGFCAAFFLPMALIGCAVCFNTVYWFNITPYYVGLFQRCDNWTTICDSVSNFYTVQGYELFETTWTYGVPLLLSGCGVLGVSLLLLVFYPCHRKVNCSKIACAIITAIIILIGLLLLGAGIVLFILYSVNQTNGASISWSFYVGCGTAGFAFLSTLLFWIHLFYLGCCDRAEEFDD